jgi:hypothetical protein
MSDEDEFRIIKNKMLLDLLKENHGLTEAKQIMARRLLLQDLHAVKTVPEIVRAVEVIIHELYPE